MCSSIRFLFVCSVVSMLLNPFSLKASEPLLRMDPNEIQRGIWVSNALYHLNENRAFELVPIAHFLNLVYASAPDRDPTEVSAQIRKVQDQLKRISSSPAKGLSQDVAEAAVDLTAILLATQGVPGAASALKIGVDLLKIGSGFSGSLDNAPAEQGSVQSWSTESVAKEFEDLFILGRLNGKAAVAIDATLGLAFNAKLSDSPEEIFEKNPSFDSDRRIHQIHKILASSEQRGVAVSSLLEIQGKTFGEILDKLKQGAELMKQTNRQLNADAYERGQAQIRAAYLNGANASVYLLSSAVRLVDSRLAKEVSVVGWSAVSVAQSVTDYASGISKLSGLARTMSAAAMTGNIVSALSNVISLFSSDSKATDFLILEEVGQLRKEVMSLSRSMHERFDRIDRRLNEVYIALDKRLDQIETGVVSARRNILSLRDELKDLEFNVRGAMQDGFRRNFLRDIDECLRNQSMSLREYRRCLSRIVSHGAIDSRDKLSKVDLSHASYEMITELVSSSPDQMLDFLQEYAFKHGNARIRSSGLGFVNPDEWALATKYYLEMKLAHWDRFQNLNIRKDFDELASLISAGNDLRAFVKNITPASIEKGTADPGFLKSAIDEHKKALESFHEQLKNIRESGEAKLSIGKNMIVNLAGDAPPVGRVDLPNYIYACPGASTEGFGNGLDTPKDFLRNVPSLYRQANELGLAKVEVCYSELAWSDVEEKEYSQNDGACFIKLKQGFGRLNVTLQARFSGKTIKEAHVSTSEKFQIGQTSESSEGCRGRKNDSYRNNLGAMIQGQWTGNFNFQARFNSDDSPYGDQAKKEAVELVTGFYKTANESYALEVESLDSVGKFNASIAAVDRTRAVVTAFVRLGFSHSMENDDRLRGILNGREKISDGQAIKAAIFAHSFNERFLQQELKKLAELDALLSSKVGERGGTESLLPLEPIMRRLEALNEIQASRYPKEPIETVLKKIRASLSRLTFK